MTELRLFSGVVQMRDNVERAGSIKLHNEHWVGWYLSREEAIGDWVSRTTSKHSGQTMNWHSRYDITDAALQQLVRPAGSHVE